MAPRDGAAEPAALADKCCHQHSEAFLGDMAGDNRERLRELAPVAGTSRRDDDTFDSLEQHLGSAALVEHGELGRNIGLQRKAAEQRLAEGGSCSELQPAWGVEDA